MCEAQLRSRLNELADAESDLCRAIRADCERSNPFADDNTCVRAAERQKVIEILREQPEFHAGRLMMWAESSLHALYDTGLPHALIRRARAEGPDAAMQFLRDVLTVEEAEFLRVVPIWGLSVDEPTWLADDICIAPMHKIPSSPPYDYFRKEYRPSLLDHFFAILPPRVALIASFQTKPFVIASGYVPPPLERQVAVERLNDVRLCLSLVGPRTIVPSVHWEQFADPRLADIMMRALAYSKIEIMPQEIAGANEPLDLDAAGVILSALNEHRHKDRVRFALARFDNGMRRRTPGDRAVEMAIALEALLINDKAPAGYRLALRSAILRGGTLDARIKTRSTIQGISKIRNKAVHEGITPHEMNLSGMGTVVVTDFMTDAIRVVADVIRATIIRKRLLSESDWFAEEMRAGGIAGPQPDPLDDQIKGC